LARFIILRGGSNYKVFDFDGNIARVGSGSNVDLSLEGVGVEGDLMFLTRSGKGYEIEPRSNAVSIAVNGKAISGRIILQKKDKVACGSYLMVVSYRADNAEAPKGPAETRTENASMTMPDGTAPIMTLPAAEPVRAPLPPVEKPRPAPAVAEAKPTMLIDSEALQRQASPPKKEAVDRSSNETVRFEAVSDSPKPEPKAKKTSTEALYSLVALTGLHKGRTFDIDKKEFLLGRDSHCDVVIDRNERGDLDKSVSREHFVINTSDEGLYLTDRKSMLRTFINGKVIEAGQRELIAPEDIISIPAPSGEIVFRLCFAGEENFEPYRRRGSMNKMVLILAGAVVVLIVFLAWLLGR